MTGRRPARGSWRRWAEHTQVERVELYTWQSLVSLLLGVPVLMAIGAADRLRDESAVSVVVVLALGAVVTLAGLPVLREVCDRYPAPGPLSRRAVVPLLLVAAVLLVAALPLPDHPRGFAVVTVASALTWSLGGLRDRRVTAALLVGCFVVGAVAARHPAPGLGLLVVGGFFVFTARVSLWVLGVVRELDRARGAQAALAVAEERLRFSRDVHDVLGRRLSAIALQAELAASLAGRGDPSAPERMLEVRATAHEALRETRELARGYRSTSLPQELDGARSLLGSAGIRLEHDVDRLPAAWHEAAGWVVREAVTNVLRHSGATRVGIGYDGEVLTVANDRPHPPSGSGGSGLDGLAARLAPLGAVLEVERDDDRYAVGVRMPAGGPLA